MNPGFNGYNAKSCSCWNTAANWYHDYGTATTTSQQLQCTYDNRELLENQSLRCDYDKITELTTPYIPSTECCDKCEIRASAVQLVFWPPANASFNASTGINTTGLNIWNVTAASVQSAALFGVVEDGFTL